MTGAHGSKSYCLSSCGAMQSIGLGGRAGGCADVRSSPLGSRCAAGGGTLEQYRWPRALLCRRRAARSADWRRRACRVVSVSFWPAPTRCLPHRETCCGGFKKSFFDLRNFCNASCDDCCSSFLAVLERGSTALWKTHPSLGQWRQPSAATAQQSHACSTRSGTRSVHQLSRCPDCSSLIPYAFAPVHTFVS